MKKYLSILVALAIVLSILGLSRAALAQDGVEITVGLGEWYVAMSDTTLPANTPITFVITNEGSVDHEAVLEIEGAVDEPLTLDGEAAAARGIAPGETVTVVWTIPEAGQYQLACHLPGHYEAGMVQAFTVEAAAEEATATPTEEATATPTEAATAAPTEAATAAATEAATAAATPVQLPETGGGDGGPMSLLLLGVAILIVATGLLVGRRRLA